jgi:hypothetical protein
MTTVAATQGTPAGQSAAAPVAATAPFFLSHFQIKNNPNARYVIDTKAHSVVPLFARDELVPWARKTHDMPNIGVISGTPDEYLNKKVQIRKNARNVMQSGNNNEHHWKVAFHRSGNWVNQLMGWASSGDSLQASGARLMKFDSADTALAFATKMGWKAEVKKDEPKLNVLGKKAYDHNFLNVHVKKVLQVRAPPVAMKTQFAHPDKGKATWVNLGRMAVDAGTSTHHMDKKVRNVSQAFWDSKEYDSKLGAKGWRYDDDFARADELSRKLGK